MKEYFVKYLPVEEDLVDGDIFEFKMSNGEWVRGSWNTSDEKEKRKLKPFLCSQNIEVGDKFRHYYIDPKLSMEARKSVNGNKLSPDEFICDKVEDGKVWWHTENFPPHKTNYCNPIEGCFKVIGIISPKADWIKEGDRFDEEQINVLDECPNYNGKHMWKDCSCKIGFVNGVYLRDSTGHLK